MPYPKKTTEKDRRDADLIERFRDEGDSWTCICGLVGTNPKRAQRLYSARKQGAI